MSDNVQAVGNIKRPLRASISADWQPSFGLRLAARNLAHDRVRFGVTIVGVTFSVILMSLQAALLIGFAATSSQLVDVAVGDIWIVPKGTRNVDQSGDITTGRRYQALATPGVAAVEQMIVRFLPWKRPDGGIEVVIVVGVDPEHPAVTPWNFSAGSIDSLKQPDGIVIDTLYAQKLGVSRIGELIEINGHRTRISGLTSGIRAFTQSPYVFTSLNTARKLADLGEDRTTYLVVRTQNGAEVSEAINHLRSRFPDVDVWRAGAFSWRTREYWLLTTGAGAALVIAAILGLVVGVVVTAQTLYAATVERLQEYATLRAIGASKFYVHRIILTQALLAAILGFVLGISLSFAAIHFARNGTAAFLLPWHFVVALAIATAAMCAAGAVISIRKVMRIDPAMVFK